MGRARRARRIAQQAVYGGGGVVAGVGALSLAGYGLIRVEAALARRIVGVRFDGAPDDTGRYGFGPGEPLRFVVLGDSTAAGMGVAHPNQTIGAIIATGLAAFSGRSVELTNVAVVGAESSALTEQVARAREQVPQPDVAVISIGANDVTHRIDRAVSVGHLELAVRELRETGAEVIVATCPDLGALQLPQPLRVLARRWSRDLAAAQTVAVVEAGGRAVSVGNLLGPSFSSEPTVMFSEDRFHPSPAGYARVAAALLPSVIAALDLLEELPAAAQPNARRGEAVGPLAEAATRAVLEPGTEVGPAELGGQSRGPRGRWAVLLHRVLPQLSRVTPAGPGPNGAVQAPPGDATQSHAAVTIAEAGRLDATPSDATPSDATPSDASPSSPAA